MGRRRPLEHGEVGGQSHDLVAIVRIKRHSERRLEGIKGGCMTGDRSRSVIGRPDRTDPAGNGFIGGGFAVLLRADSKSGMPELGAAGERYWRRRVRPGARIV